MIFLALASSACAMAVRQRQRDVMAVPKTFKIDAILMVPAYANVSAQMLRAHAMA